MPGEDKKRKIEQSGHKSNPIMNKKKRLQSPSQSSPQIIKGTKNPPIALNTSIDRIINIVIKKGTYLK